jgi:hypothetical protein
MAPIAPAAVEFHIHHVVPAFQMNIERKENTKKRSLSVCFSARNNSGTHAINIKAVNGDIGHAANNNIPDKILRKRDE